MLATERHVVDRESRHRQARRESGRSGMIARFARIADRERGK